MSEWFTATELHGKTLPNIPQYICGIRELAKRENWISRIREKSGGGYEYHISNLPKEARETLLERAFQAAQPEQLPAIDHKTADLNLWQQDVMEARLGILRWVRYPLQRTDRASY